MNVHIQIHMHGHNLIWNLWKRPLTHIFSHTVLSWACSQTHVRFGDLLLQMRPWEYLCHRSTQIEAVNRNPGGKEGIKKYLLTFPPHHDLGVWRRVVASTYIYLGCVQLWEMCEKMSKTYQLAMWEIVPAEPSHLLSLCLAIIPREIYAFGCMVARGLFTC